jgi:signal peptidase I
MALLYRIPLKFWRNSTCRWGLMITLAALGGIAFGRNYLTSVSVVAGSSMSPTYLPGTLVCTERISGPLQRGDIILVDDGRKSYAIKRIVGMPGETVRLWRGYVFINHCMLAEPYLVRNTYTYPAHGRGATFPLGGEQYFVLGDNRANSSDSRSYGPVERSKIKRIIALPIGSARAHFSPYTLTINKNPIQPL